MQVICFYSYIQTAAVQIPFPTTIARRIVQECSLLVRFDY